HGCGAGHGGGEASWRRGWDAYEGRREWPSVRVLEVDMLKRVVLSGVLGAVVLMLCTFVANAVLGLSSRVEMRRIPNEPDVYAALKQNIVEPGAYVCNPAPVPRVGYPPGEPVFSVLYGGMGHEAAGRMMVMQVGIAFASALLAAGLLGMASVRVLSRYSRRVFFIVIVGLLIVVFSELTRYRIGGYPLGGALLLAAQVFVSWTVAGAVMALTMRPAPSTSSAA
ncbi:MAG: hypothetical protein JSU68_05085, partial [Phycisphaerales bacterium]